MVKRVDEHYYLCKQASQQSQHIEAAKTEYFRKKVEDASHDQLFKFVDKFLNVKKAPILPKTQIKQRTC